MLKSKALLLSAALTAGMAIPALAAQPASAATLGSCGSPHLVRTTAPAVKVGVTYQRTLTYTAYLDDACLSHGVRSQGVAVEIGRGDYGDFQEARYVGTSGGYQVWRATFGFDPRAGIFSSQWLSNDMAGAWASRVTVMDAKGQPSVLRGTGFRLQRFSTIKGTNAAEPTRAGTPQLVVGQLQRASWDDNHYHGHTGQLVDLQFRTMTGSYRTIKTVTSGTNGSLRATVTARVDGCYRWSYRGTTTTPAVTATGDCVDVT
jgi:hypothetical protein